MNADTPPPVVTPIPIVVPAPAPMPVPSPAPPPAPATVTYLINGRLIVVPSGSPPPNPFAPVPQIMPGSGPAWCPPWATN